MFSQREIGANCDETLWGCSEVHKPTANSLIYSVVTFSTTRCLYQRGFIDSVGGALVRIIKKCHSSWSFCKIFCKKNFFNDITANICGLEISEKLPLSAPQRLKVWSRCLKMLPKTKMRDEPAPESAAGWAGSLGPHWPMGGQHRGLVTNERPPRGHTRPPGARHHPRGRAGSLWSLPGPSTLGHRGSEEYHRVFPWIPHYSWLGQIIDRRHFFNRHYLT